MPGQVPAPSRKPVRAAPATALLFTLAVALIAAFTIALPFLLHAWAPDAAPGLMADDPAHAATSEPGDELVWPVD